MLTYTTTLVVFFFAWYAARKDLMEKIGCNHAEKMYIDGEDGKVYQTGYVIGGLWLEVYEITPMMKEA